MHGLVRDRRAFAAVAVLLLGAMVLVPSDDAAGQTAAAGPVQVGVVNYQQLGQAVKHHKGKVVVVDLWRRD